MKMNLFLIAAASTLICLTGCGSHSMTVQMETVPVSPEQTTAQTAASAIDATVTQTTAHSSEQPHTVTATAVTVPQTVIQTNSESVQTHNSETASINELSGKWETVSFSKNSGERVAYDLSDPVHRNYYIGLDLSDSDAYTLTVGTDCHKAVASLIGDVLSVRTIHTDQPVDMAFTRSSDRSSMTVSLQNGRILATLKRIDTEFSILSYLSGDAITDVSPIVGEWYYQTEDQPSRERYLTLGTLTVYPDATYSYQPADGSETKNGIVRVGYEEYADVDGYAYFRFYDNDTNDFWAGTNSITPDENGCFWIGNGGISRFFPKDPAQ